MQYPNLNIIKTQQLYTESFRGLDRRPRAGAGAFSDMLNMQGSPLPLVSTRQRRGLAARLQSPQALAAAGKIAYIDGNTLYYDHEPTPINDLSDEAPKRIAVMGAYLIVFPDAVYYNTVNPEDYGTINRLWTQEEGWEANIHLCAMDGIIFSDEDIPAADTAPENPREGDYWIDTSGDIHGLYRYSAVREEWEGIPTVYLRISSKGIGSGLSRGDGVEISGIKGEDIDPDLMDQLEALNSTHVIQGCGPDHIVITGMLDMQHTQASGISVNRKAPKMDYVVECNNRLWGCRYGETDGQMLNEIYASGLGDFKNFRNYVGTAGSYAVSVGTDGPFTGAINHRGTVYFFKQGYLHKIFGDNPSNYQMQTTILSGVQQGSENSLVSANGTLYYLSDYGVMMMESLPQNVGHALGEGWHSQGAAGEIDGKYYISMADEAGTHAIYTMDLESGYWHKEDEKHAIAFARTGRELYMLCDDGKLWAIRGTEGEQEDLIPWRLDSAVFGFELANRKYISRYNIRIKLGPWASCKFFVEYDSSGIWIPRGEMLGKDGIRTYTLPIIPRRCDHMRIRLEGRGDMTLYTIARVIELGGDENGGNENGNV